MSLNTPASPPSRLPATPTNLLGLSSFTKSWICCITLQQGRELDAGDDQNRKQPENDQVDRDEAEDHAQPGRQVVTGGQAAYRVDGD